MAEHPFLLWHRVPYSLLDEYLYDFGTSKAAIARTWHRGEQIGQSYRNPRITRFRACSDPATSRRLLNEYDEILELREEANQLAQKLYGTVEARSDDTNNS